MRKRFAACLAVGLLAGCGPRDSAVAVSAPVPPATRAARASGSEMVTFGASDPYVGVWFEGGGDKGRVLGRVDSGVKVRWLSSGHQVVHEPHDMVRILEGKHEGRTAYVSPENLRPLPPR